MATSDRPQQILVAEDDDTSFFILKTILKPIRADLYRAVDGQEAFDKYSAAPSNYDMILMDIEMPNVNGLKSAAMIRAFEVQKDIAPVMIVALTAHDEPEYHQKIFDARMNSIVNKPVKTQKLLDAMKAAMESKPQPMLSGISDLPQEEMNADLFAAIADVKKRLWTDLAHYVEQIRSHIDFGDSESIRVLGHTIKGFGGHLTNPKVTELGRAIQAAAIEKRFNDVKAKAQELMDLVVSNEQDSAPVIVKLQQLRLDTPSPFLGLGAGTPVSASPLLDFSEMGSVIAGLKVRFVQDLRADIIKINQSLGEGNFDVIARTGHILKGVGGNLGHATVTDIGKSIQSAALDKNVKQIQNLVGELQSYITMIIGEEEEQSTQSTVSVPQSVASKQQAITAKTEIRAGADHPENVQQFKRAVRATYVKDLPSHVDAIMVAIDIADWATIKRVSQSLAKAATALENEQLSGFAQVISEAATQEKGDAAYKAATELYDYLEHVQMD